LSTLIKRGITGFLIVVLIVGAISLNSLTYAGLFLAILIGALYEFYGMLKRAKIHPQTTYGIFLGILLYILSFLTAIGFIPGLLLLSLIPLLSVIFIGELFLRENRPFHNIAFTLLGLFYVAAPFSLMHFAIFHSTKDLYLQHNEGIDILNYIFQPKFRVEYNDQLLLGFFILHWVNDTGAYLFGVPFGKHKLFKRISPKKSWEGAIGGAIFAGVTSIILSKYFHNLSFTNWLIITFIVVVFGTLGDLVESMLKRYLGLKDSGKLLPGHGGILDRFDGVIFSAPVVFAYIQMIY